MAKKLKIIFFVFIFFFIVASVFYFFNDFKKAVANPGSFVVDSFTDETMIGTTTNLVVDTDSGQVSIADVCDGVANNTQVPGCNGTCQACQNETCGVAEATSDPGGQCDISSNCATGNCKGGTAECGWYTSEDRACPICQTCSGATSVACVNYTNNTQDTGCNGTCQACQSGNCGVANTDTDPGNKCSAINCYTGNCKGGTAECKIYSGGEKGACGTCYYCNDADYQCDLVSNSQDPFGDCPPVFSCLTWIYGWSGNDCKKYSGPSANDGDCNGAGACYTSVADSCTGIGATSASCGSAGCKKACVANAYYTSYDTVAEVCYTSDQQSCSVGYACDASGTCVITCGGVYYGGNCWYKASTGVSCTSFCASHGGCKATNWNDTSSCTICINYFSPKPESTSCNYYEGSGYPGLTTNPSYPGCYYRHALANQDCNATTGIQRLCVCNY